MSTEEIKAEINRVLDNLSDKTLFELLSYLKDLDSKDKTFLDVDMLNRILREDKSLLAKLAK
jgi:L-amino acid N-acyltransferase YncA